MFCTKSHTRKYSTHWLIWPDVRVCVLLHFHVLECVLITSNSVQFSQNLNPSLPPSWEFEWQNYFITTLRSSRDENMVDTLASRIHAYTCTHVCRCTSVHDQVLKPVCTKFTYFTLYFTGVTCCQNKKVVSFLMSSFLNNPYPQKINTYTKRTCRSYRFCRLWRARELR